MTAEESFKKYPYYYYPAIEALEGATGEERVKLLRRIAAGVGPESALRTLIGVDPEEFRDFYGDLDRPNPDTREAIDRFLDNYDRSGAVAGTPEIPEEIPVAPPATDYAAMMLDDGGDDVLEQDDPTAGLLNSLLGGGAAKPAPAPEPEPESEQEPEPEEPSEPEPLSEALVKIMVREGNYRKALEIISDLNLKNPKKSIYFADQIRFLNKLIQAQEGRRKQ